LPKLRVLSGAECAAILTQFGFAEIRRKGSHIIMQKHLQHSTITVPIPNHAELRTGTLMSIIRQSGIPKQAFETP